MTTGEPKTLDELLLDEKTRQAQIDRVAAAVRGKPKMNRQQRRAEERRLQRERSTARR